MKQLITVTDLKGNYTYVNQAYCQTTGYAESELLNTDTHSLTHQQMPKAVLDELSATLAKGFSWQGLLQLKSKTGKSIWLDVFITPQYCQNKITGFQCISTIANQKLVNNAEHIYQAINKQSPWATFEITKNHKFIFLILLSTILQGFIFTYLGLGASIVAAFSAIAPILVFWSDIIPTAIRAQRMQTMFDSVSRKIYFGKGTASVFDFNFSLLKTKNKSYS